MEENAHSNLTIFDWRTNKQIAIYYKQVLPWKHAKNWEGQILIALYSFYVRNVNCLQSQCMGYRVEALCFSYPNLDRDTACTTTLHMPVATCFC